MARMRSLKPEFWLDRKLARTLTRDARMLYLGLWNQADEWGRANADARVIKGQVFPFDDDLGLPEIEQLLRDLEDAGVVERYEHDGDPYLFLPKLSKHQRLEPQKVPSRHPAPPDRPADQQVQVEPKSDPNRSARGSRGAQTGSRAVRAKHVAGSREHVAGQRRADAPGPTFDDFYAAYPKKEAKRAAEKAWVTASKRASPQVILDGLRRFRFSPESRFIPQPATWLNADRWADGEGSPAAPGGPPARTFTRTELDEILGPDSWQLPAPPPEIDPEAEGGAVYRRWAQERTEAHRAERVRQALTALDRQR